MYERLISSQLNSVKDKHYMNYYNQHKPKDPTIVITYGPL